MTARIIVMFALILLFGAQLWLQGRDSGSPAAASPAGGQLPPAISLPVPELLFPDLRTVAADDLLLDIEIIGTLPMHVLRFSTTIWNAGPGPLELRGDLSTGQTLVYQRVFDRQGPAAEYFAGNFVFHPGHNHWHFENFARYELWTAAAYRGWLESGQTIGAPAWLSSKTAGQGDSFCLRDSRPMAGIAAAPFRYADCDPNGQGISVGWSDVYSRDLPDQWIEVPDGPLPDGAYVLRIVADPANLIYESPERADPTRDSADANEALTRFSVVAGVVTNVEPVARR